MGKRGLLIYPSTTPRENNAFGWFMEAAARYGIGLQVLFYDAPVAQAPVGASGWKPDFVLMRGYNIALSKWYEEQGVKVINSSGSMILCRDKRRSGEVLAAAGVPVPKVLSMEEAAGGAAYPFILKLNFGSKGENVFLVRNETEYRDALEACRREETLRLEALARGVSEFGETPEEIRCGCEPLLQEFVASSSGRDIRVWVTGEEVAGHVLRYNPSSFKSNFAAGGSFRQIPLPPEAASTALAAARACGLFFAGVDLLYDGDGGFKVCEINGNAGFRTASADIPDALFRNIRKII
ncbi:MAG TPA: ATP-grasp domain-containing protein [Candidatus Coprenecus stercoravium]|uniref:ATP-grasp domain-containing protein n=1 Tax=Candidatus Coprenecus stercoravium TaxID=2840735 RepID=A0A9D2GS77_9BACT|nr:ATP-grasp domain-containing protein [Candidatus Coprenecus stercoravium]